MPSALQTSDDTGGFNPEWYHELFQAEQRHCWFRARNRLITTLAAQALEDAPGSTILEIGCGNGNVTHALQEAFPHSRVIGMDLFGEGFAFAKRRGVRDLIQADARQSPFSIDFDLIGIFDVLEHIPEDEAVLRDLHGLIRPDGALLVTVPAHMSLWSYTDELSHHCRRYELAEITEKTKHAGFEVQFASDFMSALYPILWTYRKLFGGSAAKSPSAEEGVERSLAELRINPVLNMVLGPLLNAEVRRLTKRRRMPRGTSIVVLARRA